jgi:putative NADH-flavin reductase
MNITIIGSSSGIGLLTVKQALAKGHHVTTLSRSVQTLPAHPSLATISGSATSTADLIKATTHAAAVIICIGQSKARQATLFTDTGRALIALQLKIPIIIITGFGAGDSQPYNSFLFRLILGTMMKKEYADKTQMENMLAGSQLQWEIVRPGMLTNGPLTGKYQSISQLYRGMKVKPISRADVADFLLSQAEHPTLLHQYVTLTY